ncbi:MAG: iron-sulfur cluster assembly scaffold protein [Rhodospirillales bacterium]
MFDDVRDLYQDIILRHSRQPLHMRRLENFDARAVGDNPMCGDRCEVRLRLDPDGTIADIGFEARGCAISLASADLMAEATAGAYRTASACARRGFFRAGAHRRHDKRGSGVAAVKAPVRGCRVSIAHQMRHLAMGRRAGSARRCRGDQ